MFWRCVKQKKMKNNSRIEELLQEIREMRNDMVARNYPYQQLTNLIYKWEDILREEKDEN